MRILVDRRQKTVRVSGLTVNEACWLGHKFSRELVKESWDVVCFDDIPERYNKNAEKYEINTTWDTSALKIENIIHNPPSVHDCPGCECIKEECCK